MTGSQRSVPQARFRVEKIGGIDEATVEVPPGVTVLAGKNATNRTSFLQAIRAALGSRAASLKGDADSGAVELQFGEETYDRELVRRNGTVSFSGESYLSDPTLADLFAFLLEDNEARRAVAREDDLREIIMRPVDVAAIREEIDRLEDRKAEINEELAEIGELKGRLPDLEQRRTALRQEIEEKREALAAKEEEIEESSADVRETREEKAKLEEKLEELRDTRGELGDVRRDLDATEESIESLERERNEVREEIEDLPETPMGDHADLEAEIDRLRAEKESIDRSVQDLQSAIQFNEEMVESDGDALAELAGDDAADAGDPTDRLLEDEGTVCWTCGSVVEDDRIEETLESLRSIRQSRLSESKDVEERLEELRERQREAERAQERRSNLEDRLRRIEDELEDRRERREELSDRRSALTEEVESLEAAVEDLESEDFSEVLDLHREANQLEFELDGLEDDLAEITDEIERVEAEIEREDDLEARREELLDELEEQRTRIERIEADAVDAFNTHMDAVLDVLGYDNLDRVWIERREESVRDGRRKTTQAVFDLHVVRSTDSGAAYEDTVSHLSESEREVTGLIFALAGYLVHDVHEEAPFMLLDSLEAIDADRIAALVEYFAEYADYLVVALLPEDARALPDEYTRIEGV